MKFLQCQLPIPSSSTYVRPPAWLGDVTVCLLFSPGVRDGTSGIHYCLSQCSSVRPSLFYPFFLPPSLPRSIPLAVNYACDGSQTSVWIRLEIRLLDRHRQSCRLAVGVSTEPGNFARASRQPRSSVCVCVCVVCLSANRPARDTRASRLETWTTPSTSRYFFYQTLAVDRWPTVFR